MEMSNAICMVGNHELMALECLEFLMKEITDASIKELEAETLDNLLTWQMNGSESTIGEFRALSPEEKQEVIDFLKEFIVYEEITVANQEYLLVHAGLGSFAPEKDIEDYSLHDLIWARADYDKQYFEDRIVITGHTPTQCIEHHEKPGFIYRKKHHIAIDCGASHPGGRLAAICLDTGEEFYSSPNQL